MIYTDFEQRSAEWLQMRCGCVTASRMGDVLAKLKKSKNEATDRADYREELISERLTGDCLDHYVNEWMKAGVFNEPFARAAYELKTDAEVLPVGFALHDTIKWYGGSPDSLVGREGLLEVKCLKSNNHVKILNSREIPDKYKPQLQAELSVTGREWVDFVAYHPKMPDNLKLFIKRFYRDDKEIAAMEAEVKQFLAEVQAMKQQIEVGDLTPILVASVAEAK